MSDLAKRLAALTPEQRAMLEARLKQRQQPPAPGAAVPPQAPRPADGPPPAAFPQERLWFLERLEGLSATYNVCAGFRLSGKIDAALLDRALKEIVRRHEALRTLFASPDPDQPPVQVIGPVPERCLELITITPDEADAEAAVRLRVQSLARQPMSLERGPLARFTLVSRSANEHVLVIVLHHIISDGWSLDILFRELSRAYADLAQNRPVSLAHLPAQYADFARWQRTQLSDPAFEKEIAFWTNKLAGAAPVFEFPTDFPRPAEQSYEGSCFTHVIGPELKARLEALSATTGTTLFMVVQAAFKLLLLRYTRQPDIVIGAPVANRSRSEFEPLIGFFVNMLVLRTDLSGNPSFREILGRVRATTLEAMAHQRVPFERLVQAMQPKRSRSYSPLFQIALMYQQHQSDSALTFPGVTVSHHPVHTDTSRYDLSVFVTETDGTLRLDLEYATRLFKSETIARLAGHFECLLACVAAQPDQAAGAIDFLPPDERDTIVHAWNRTSLDYAREKTVHGLFAEQVRRTPDHVAVRFKDQALTYAALDQRATQLAHALRAAGARPGSLVGIFVERSLDMVVGVMGILKSGAAYVPMDPAFPSERLGYMVEDADMALIVTQSGMEGRLPPHQATIVLVSATGPVAAPAGAADSGPADVAYTIFTSGSTGRPKGVQIPHRAVVNFLNSMAREPGIRREDVVLSVTTLSFDIAGLELFLPLTTGATVVVASRETAMDGKLLQQEMKRCGATFLQATPATWRVLLESGWPGDKGLKVLCGGEPLPRDLAERLIPVCGELWNLYGPTETTIWSTGCRITDAADIHIGRPIDNTQVYIVGDGTVLQPTGVPGELLIGGDGVALGYLKRPELTAEKFIPDPFSSVPGARLYRTGDLARWRPDGNLDCLGRIDQQVKIRGFRIELGEIETVLLKQPGVRQGAVAVRDDGAGGKRLVAYVVAESGAAIGSAELRTEMRATLPDYMVPSVVMVLERLPLTPNGKIDRKALPEPTAAAPAERVVEAPRNEVEQRVAAIFADVLGIALPGIHENFFDLGGHSLLAVKLMARIEKEFDRQLPLALLFSAPTVADLAAHLARGESSRERTWSSLVPIQEVAGAPALFLVHGAGGNVLLYRELARALAPAVSTYGFQSIGLDQRQEPYRTIDAMARHYIEELTAFQPAGPYYIGGYCMGGIVAFEMSRILREQGAEVRLVAMLDSYNLGSIPARDTRRQRISAWRQKIGFHVKNLRALSLAQLRGYVGEKARMAVELAGNLLRVRTSRLGHGRGGTESRIQHIQDVNDDAAWSHKPGWNPGPIVLFRPETNYDFMSDPLQGWGGYVAGGPEVVQLPINPHAMLIEPFVRTLAPEIARRIHGSADAGSPRVESEAAEPVAAR